MTKPTTGTNRRALLQSLLFTGAAASFAGAAGTRAFAAEPKSPNQLHGLYPIAFTPVAANDKVDMDGLAAQVKFCQRGQVHGIAWPQIASGWSVLSQAERLEGAEVMLSAAKGGKTKVLIGVQSPEWTEVERYARHADQHGADAIICIPPAGMSDEKLLLDFYKKVGGFTALPMFAQSGGTMSTDLLVAMYENIPNFRYVKDEAGNPLERVIELNARTKGGLNVFSGNGVATLVTEMERGFAGHCPFTSLSDMYAAAFDAFHGGNRQKAFQLHGIIEAASRMFAQNNIQVMVARGVFKPGTRGRLAPLAPGSTPANAYMAASTPAEIRRVLDTYLKPYLRA